MLAKAIKLAVKPNKNYAYGSLERQAVFKEFGGVNNMRKPTKNWIDRVCLKCARKFKGRPCEIKRGSAKYCSKLCRNYIAGKRRAELRDQKGENNHNYKGGISKNNYHYKLKFKAKNIEKVRSHNLVRHAKKSGRLKMEPCFKCGASEKIQAHHEDYSKPLDVIWVCQSCHHDIHNDRVLPTANN